MPTVVQSEVLVLNTFAMSAVSLVTKQARRARGKVSLASMDI